RREPHPPGERGPNLFPFRFSLTRGSFPRYINSRSGAETVAPAPLLSRKEEKPMAHSETPEHGAPVSGQTYFPDPEWQAFRREDATAGKYIIGLMVGIFITGLLLYLGVAYSVLSRAA